MNVMNEQICKCANERSPGAKPSTFNIQPSTYNPGATSKR